MAVLATCAYAAHSMHDGIDFITCIWGPERALLHGIDPYDPANSAYLGQYAVPHVAPLYTPAALLLHAPLVVLSQARAADAMAAIDAALLWGGVLLVVPPRSPRACAIAGLCGSLLVSTAAAQETIALGQLSALAFFGLCLLAATADSSDWWPAVGVVLVSLKPQSAIPIFVLLAVLGHWRVVVRAAGLLAASSLPGLVLFVRAAGGVGEVRHTVTRNLDFFSHYVTNDLASRDNTRVDVLALVDRFHGPTLNAFSWSLLLLVAFAVLLAVACRAAAARGRRPRISDPWVLAAVSIGITACLYHQIYDPLLFFCGPLAALGSWVAWREVRGLEDRWLLLGGAALLLFELVFRGGFRLRMIDHGLTLHTVETIYFSVPTIIIIVTVAVTMFIAVRHTSGNDQATLVPSSRR